MSYDVDIGYECFNYTYNCAPMFNKAFNSIENFKKIIDLTGQSAIPALDGMTGKQARIFLKDAIIYFEKNEAELKKIAPINGWGDYDGALEFLKNIYNYCLKHGRSKLTVT